MISLQTNKTENRYRKNVISSVVSFFK